MLRDPACHILAERQLFKPEIKTVNQTTTSIRHMKTVNFDNQYKVRRTTVGGVAINSKIQSL